MDIGHFASTAHSDIPNVYAREPTSTTEVSWQVVFWILVALAINVMAQPSGKVCGLPSRYGIYLRSSPIICAADILSTVIHLLVNKLYLRAPWRASIGLLLYERFESNDDHSESQGEGLESLERWTWIRWLFFILGTLPPAIKLASMHGLPWTKTWGMLFLGSFALLECLVMFATFNQSFFTISEQGHITWPGHAQYSESTNFRATQRMLKSIDLSLAGVAVIVHFLFVGVCDGILFVGLRETGRIWEFRPEHGYKLFFNYIVGMFTASILTYLGSPGIMGHISFWVMLIMVHVAISICLWAVEWPLVIYLHVNLLVTASLLLPHVGRRFPYLGRNLLIVHPAPLNNVETTDNWACLALGFFFQMWDCALSGMLMHMTPQGL